MGFAKGFIPSVAVAAAVLLAALPVRADDLSAWLAGRQTRFAAFRAAHPRPDAEIARIKVATAARLAAAAPSADLQAGVDRPPIAWSPAGPRAELWDGAAYPEMVVVPAGENTMGSPLTEVNHQTYEDPRHRVRITHAFAIGKYPVTVGEFALFVAETHYDAGDHCFTSEPGEQPAPGRDWRKPSFDQTSAHPATCLNFKDAQAYVAWLSAKTGHPYRLPTEAEYEYATRAGTTTAYWWGDDPNAACAYANAADLDYKARFPDHTASTCHDGYVFTAPVGSFRPNPFGLYDMVGEGWSWLADCWSETYATAPVDGGADLGGDCAQRILRQGSWSARPTMQRSAGRIRYPIDIRVDDHGFRVARSL